MKRRHSASGQNAKYSSRTDVFRFGLEFGHCPTAGISHLCQQATLTEGALPAVCLFGTGLYAAVVRVLKIGLAVCPLLAWVFANRLALVGTIFLGTEKEPPYSALRCSWGFFGARARGQENQNQDHRRGCQEPPTYGFCGMLPYAVAGHQCQLPKLMLRAWRAARRRKSSM